MRIEKDDNLSSGYRILGSSDSWDIEEDRLSIRVSDAKILPMSGDDMLIDIYGEGPRQIAEDIMELSREQGREELDVLKDENESLKETIEILQRQLDKEKCKRSELEQVKGEPAQGADSDRDALDARTYSVLPVIERTDNTNHDPELYTAMKILIARHNETVMENNRLRKRNEKLRQDFESIKGHLRVAQHKLDKYERDKRYSEMFVANHPGQSLTFKDAKVSVSDNGDVTVSGQSVENLIDRLDGLIDTEARFTEWQNIVLKQVEANPGIFNERIKEN